MLRSSEMGVTNCISPREYACLTWRTGENGVTNRGHRRDEWLFYPGIPVLFVTVWVKRCDDRSIGCEESHQDLGFSSLGPRCYLCFSSLGPRRPRTQWGYTKVALWTHQPGIEAEIPAWWRLHWVHVIQTAASCINYAHQIVLVKSYLVQQPVCCPDFFAESYSHFFHGYFLRLSAGICSFSCWTFHSVWAQIRNRNVIIFKLRF